MGTIVSHIVPDALKGYLLFPSVLMKDTQCHLKFPWNIKGLYQTKIAVHSVISLVFGQEIGISFTEINATLIV
jgi:hypothetical protein